MTASSLFHQIPNNDIHLFTFKQLRIMTLTVESEGVVGLGWLGRSTKRQTLTVWLITDSEHPFFKSNHNVSLTVTKR